MKMRRYIRRQRIASKNPGISDELSTNLPKQRPQASSPVNQNLRLLWSDNRRTRKMANMQTELYRQAFSAYIRKGTPISLSMKRTLEGLIYRRSQIGQKQE